METSDLREQIKLRAIIVRAFDAGVRAAEMQGTLEYRRAKVFACERGEAAIKAHSLQERIDEVARIDNNFDPEMHDYKVKRIKHLEAQAQSQEKE